MLRLLQMRRLRANLARTLQQDIAQPSGWEPWLQRARSTRDLYTACEHPGWLVYLAYWEGVSQDKLLEGALLLARHAAERDSRPPLAASALDGLRDKTWDELGSVIVELERAHPITPLLVDALPTQLCYGLSHIRPLRVAAREPMEAIELPPDLGPFRTRPTTTMVRDIADGLVAAGYVLTIEALFFREENLRESLAIRAAAAAALLHASCDGFDADALALLRDLYGL